MIESTKIKINLTTQQIEDAIVSNARKYPLGTACTIVGQYLKLFISLKIEINEDNLINRLWDLLIVRKTPSPCGWECKRG